MIYLDNAATTQVCRLIAAHDDNPPLTDKSVRRAVVRNGREAYPSVFELKRADILAQSDYMRQEKLKYMEEYEAIYTKIMEREQCLSVKELAVSGDDLIALGLKPGPKLGAKLKELLEIVLEEPEKNTKEYLTGCMKKAKESIN